MSTLQTGEKGMSEVEAMQAEIAYIRGHLEGYADALEANYATNDPEVLAIALRGDARRLKAFSTHPHLANQSTKTVA